MDDTIAEKVSVVSYSIEEASLRIFICDDEEEHLKELLSVIKPLQEKQNLSIEKFLSANALITELQQRKMDGQLLPKVIFVDIVMPEMDGITLAKTIKEIAPDSYLIFTTAYAEYAIRGYEARAFRYILKPVTTEQIEKIIRDIYKEMKKSKKLLVKGVDGEYIKKLEDIMYLSAEDKYTILHTENGHFMDRTSLNEYEELLRQYGFCRIHRKYIVNTTYHKCIVKRDIVLKNGVKLPISVRKEKEYRKILFQEMDGEVLK